MTNRGYTLLDFSIPQLIGNDLDHIVRFLEYVRTYFHELVPGVPSSCELDLIAGETAHSSGLHPLLVLFVPEADINSLPHPFAMIDTLSAWSAALSTTAFESIIAETPAPKWDQLLSAGVYPSRDGS